MSFKEYLGIDAPLIPRLATGFGGGIGRKGSICGALAGAVMALGMKLGRTDANDKDRRERTYEKCYEFCSQFEKEFGSQACRDLTGVHLDNPEERKIWLESGGMKKCASIVEKTAEMLCQWMETLPTK